MLPTIMRRSFRPFYMPNFFDDDFLIKDINGNSIARLNRNIWAIPWYWEFKIYNKTSPGADMRVLSVLAGTKSFEKSGDNDGGDVCNQYFWTTGILVLLLVITASALGIIGSLVYYNNNKKKLERLLDVETVTQKH